MSGPAGVPAEPRRPRRVGQLARAGARAASRATRPTRPTGASSATPTASRRARCTRARWTLVSAARRRPPTAELRRRAPRGAGVPALPRHHRRGRTPSSAPTPADRHSTRTSRRGADGDLTGRVVGALWWDRATRARADRRPGRAPRRAGTSGRFAATSVKIMQDGVCENFTAATLDALPRRRTADPTDNRGHLVRRARAR